MFHNCWKAKTAWLGLAAISWCTQSKCSISSQEPSFFHMRWFQRCLPAVCLYINCTSIARLRLCWEVAKIPAALPMLLEWLRSSIWPASVLCWVNSHLAEHDPRSPAWDTFRSACIHRTASSKSALSRLSATRPGWIYSFGKSVGCSPAQRWENSISLSNAAPRRNTFYRVERAPRIPQPHSYLITKVPACTVLRTCLCV